MPSFPHGTQARSVKVAVLTEDNFDHLEDRVNTWLDKNPSALVYGVDFVTRGNHVAAYITHLKRRS